MNENMIILTEFLLNWFCFVDKSARFVPITRDAIIWSIWWDSSSIYIYASLKVNESLVNYTYQTHFVRDLFICPHNCPIGNEKKNQIDLSKMEM